MDNSGFPRTPDGPVKLLGTYVRYQRSVETTIDARGPNFLGGSATISITKTMYKHLITKAHAPSKFI